MLAYRETMSPVEDEQEETLEETEFIREEMGDGSADPEVENPGEPSTGDAPIEEAKSEEYRPMSEGVAIEDIKLAASHGNAQATKLLLIQWDQNPLPSQYCLLHDAAEFGHAESVDILINYGADTEETNPDYLRTPLVYSAVVNADIVETETLIRRSANVDAQYKDSKTVMHYAAANNRLDIVQILVEVKADPEAEDNEYMVQKGVSLKHKNTAGVDPLDLAVNSPADNGETYSLLAVSRSVVLLHLSKSEEVC